MPQPTGYKNRLAGKVAIVTGAGSQGAGFGTGKATAIVLAGEGARVCLVDQNADRADETLRLIEAEGGQAFASCGDVTDDADCRRFAEETVGRFGTIDILVNNVGISGSVGTYDLFDERAWERTLDVNIKSAVLMARHVVPVMQKHRSGSVINISSLAALVAEGAGLAYGPSKAALSHLSRELAVMYGRDGIRFNSVAPGHIYTPMVAAISERNREIRRLVGPLGIEGDSWDVALATLFLASDDARFITGQQIAVDGGVSIIAPMRAISLVDDLDRSL